MRSLALIAEYASFFIVFSTTYSAKPPTDNQSGVIYLLVSIVSFAVLFSFLSISDLVI